MRCELLSNFCIFDILNNRNINGTTLNQVVNCFQISVSLIFWTTGAKIAEIRKVLWIAFKFLYLWYSEQPALQPRLSDSSCELLSNFCIFDILNNTDFQVYSGILLWIAFKFLYLWYSEQPTALGRDRSNSCELLSNFCIFDILNNYIYLQ